MLTVGIRVSAATRERVRLASRLDGRTESDVVDAAVAEYLERHRAEVEAGFAHARSVLMLDEGDR